MRFVLGRIVHGVERSAQGHGTQRSWACAEGGKCFPAHQVNMALGESRPGVARSARPGGWGHHRQSEERRDKAASRSERIGAWSRGFKRIGALSRLMDVFATGT